MNEGGLFKKEKKIGQGFRGPREGSGFLRFLKSADIFVNTRPPSFFLQIQPTPGLSPLESPQVDGRGITVPDNDTFWTSSSGKSHFSRIF
jgi:hypothetical protein